jgi:hypothetical protein
VRQQHSRPLIDAMHGWLHQQLERVSGRSALAKAIRYALNHWNGLIQFLPCGILCKSRSYDLTRWSNVEALAWLTDVLQCIGISCRYPRAPLPPLLLIECPFCGQENTYEKKQIRVLRAPPKVTPPPR